MKVGKEEGLGAGGGRNSVRRREEKAGCGSKAPSRQVNICLANFVQCNVRNGETASKNSGLGRLIKKLN